MPSLWYNLLTKLVSWCVCLALILWIYTVTIVEQIFFSHFDENVLYSFHLFIVGIVDSWLLDGFPRTIAQAEYLWNFQPVESVINLHVPHDVIIERVKDRWVHLQSGRVYNLHFNKPKVEGLDDLTGEELVQREDDKPETVRKRLEIYEECIKPMADFYRKLGILVEFEGRTTNEIWPKIEEYLEKSIK